MRIVVLAGGKSDEHDVSMSSGSMIANALIAKGHQVLLLDLSMDLPDVSDFDTAYQKYKKEQYSATILSTFTKQHGKEIGENIIEICRTAQMTFVGLHGGIGENGKLAALFDIYDIKYTGTGYQGSLLAMNKQISKELLRFHGFLTANWKVITKNYEPSTISLPAVVKPIDNGSSIGVSLVNHSDDLKTAVEETLTYTNNGKLLIEDKIEGREFSVGVLGKKVLPVIEIRPKNGFYDYTNKYQQGLTEEITPAVIANETKMKLQHLAKEVHELFSLEVYSRTDFLLSDSGDIFIIEANSLPGMTPTSLFPQEAQAKGIEYEDLCQKIIELSMQKSS
ncbi:D-alanine--D-alanine ligase [Tetragenococcus muriaticus]|uniref:D-alanine--D-alanine ligase n=1 Tax=Tetragenococcus muriaticus 3MR10-3 TaxID=1302648 RepID=A0A091CDE5_9ENTE|nr:D-alanine--D-alanine ligase [Tetragenococcus muriaticus]KFN91943.1 D-alanine--D-alanine ligase [Tetragenococcus muriaticus 3MR10-3]